MAGAIFDGKAGRPARPPRHEGNPEIRGPVCVAAPKVEDGIRGLDAGAEGFALVVVDGTSGGAVFHLGPAPRHLLPDKDKKALPGFSPSSIGNLICGLRS